MCVAALSSEQISLSVDVPSPSSPTRLLPRITSVGTPTWVNLVDAVCAFDAELSIQVDGPIVTDKPILLASPLEVTHLEFSPKFIRPGSNIIQLQIQAKVYPAPDRTDLTFELRPPKQDVLRVEVSDTIDFSVIGPEPARLVLQSGGEVLSSLCVDSPGALTVTPIVLGAPRSAVPKETAAFFTFDRSLMLDMRSPEVPMFLPATILSQGDDNQSASFFFDAVKEGKLKVTLSPSSAAVCGSEYPITRTRPAPFKKVLFVAAVSLAILCLLFLPFRLFCRLQGLSLEPHSDVRKAT